MGGKSSPPPPPVPDYAGIAQQQAGAQTQLTNQQTWANRPNVSTPWGTQSWTTGTAVDPSTGQHMTTWNQNVSLSPQQQAALDSQMGVQTGLSQQAQSMLNNVKGSYGQPMNWGGFTPLAGTPQAGDLTKGINPTTSNFSPGVGGSSAYTGQAGDALYKQATSRLDPQFNQQQELTDSGLLAKGITRGSEAWNQAQDQLSRSRNDAYQTAANNATMMNTQQAQALQGMDVSSQQAALQGQQQQFAQQAQAGQFGNAAQAQAWQQAMQGGQFTDQTRQQQIAEATAQRNQPLNEMNALLSGQQVGNPNFPQFQSAGAGTAPNMLGATGMGYQAGIDQYNAGVNSQNAQQQNAMQGIGSLAALYFSDRSLKRGIKRVGATKRGTPTYLYKMHGKLQYGVLAQEAPVDARVNVGGITAVDYSKV